MLAPLKFVIPRLVDDRRGASAVEYALVAAPISVAAIAALTTIGQKIQNELNAASTGIN